MLQKDSLYLYGRVTGKPEIMLVGGPDVDARIPLMALLRHDFSMSAVGSNPYLRSRFEQAGFDYYTYPLARGPNLLADIQTTANLLWLFRRLQPHIVHAFDTKPCVHARMAARLAGVPVVIGTIPGLGSLYVENSLKGRLIRAAYEPLQKRACHISDLSIFQNHADMRQFVASKITPEAKTVVIPGSGVRTDIYSPEMISPAKRQELRRELKVPPHAVLVTMISRLLRSKGIMEFVEAARMMGEQCPEVCFLLVGPEDPDSMDRLTPDEMARLRTTVTWPGARSDIRAVLAASDIFVLPSVYREGIPRVLLEASSMGLPCITTNSPGCHEVVIDGQTGLLIRPGDTGGLVDAIAHLIQNAGLRRHMGQAGRERTVTLFDLAIIAGQILSTYLELLEKKGFSDGRISAHS